MKKLALIAAIALSALTNSAHAQIDVGTYSIRTTPVLQVPANNTVYLPNGR